MSSFQTKASRAAFVTEVTEGTPVAPTASSEYLALQDGFDVESAFDTLENAELTGSIGKAKPILGLENPTVSIDHYIRHSGVEGQEPNFGRLIESVFGAKSVNATQYVTAAGSTAGTALAAGTINHAVGTGTNFERGEALLIKDGTNGYSIRNVHSISTDTSTLNFNLNNAPAAAVGLGKAVLYKPGSAYPTFSAWVYRGNGGAIEMVAGARVTEMTIEAEAGQFIKGSFSFEGLSYFFDPIEITSATRYIDFNDGSDKSVALALGFYKDPKDLAAAAAALMDAASSDTISVSYSSSTGKFTFSSSGGTFNIEWNTGANTANSAATKFGFSAAADSSGGGPYTGANAITLTSPQTPTYDSADPLVAKNNEFLVGDFADITCYCASKITFKIGLEKADVLCVCAESGKQEIVVTGREVSMELTGTLSRYDADKFHRYHSNTTTKLMYNFGEKSGGNWVPGKCGNIYMPTATITAHKVGDGDGLVTLDITATAFVDSNGNGEVYLNFL